MASRHGLPRGLIVLAADDAVYIINRRIRAVFILQLESVPLSDKSGNIAPGVINVTESQCPGLAGIHTGRGRISVYSHLETVFKTVIDALHAKIAFHGGADLVRIELFSHFFEFGLGISGEIARVFILSEKRTILVGTCDDAITTPDTLVGIDPDDAVFPLLRRFGGAHIHAGRLFALVATHRESGHIHHAVIFGLTGDQFNPGNMQGQKMLNPAGGNTCVTATTFCEVYYHSPFHCVFSFILYAENCSVKTVHEKTERCNSNFPLWQINISLTRANFKTFQFGQAQGGR